MSIERCLETLKYAIVNGNGLYQIILNGNEESLVMQASEKSYFIAHKVARGLGGRRQSL